MQIRGERKTIGCRGINGDHVLCNSGMGGADTPPEKTGDETMTVRFKIVKDVNGVLQWLRLGDYELLPVQSPEVEKNEAKKESDRRLTAT